MEMKSERTYGAFSGLLRRLPLPPSVSGSCYAARSTTPSEVNRPSFWAGHCTEGQKFHQIQAQECRSPKTTVLLGLTVPWEHIWSNFMDEPMKQEVRDTCAVVACVKCLQGVHWMQYVKLHGNRGLPFQFPWRCMAAARRKLFVKCVTDDIWLSRLGADVGKILNKIVEMRGLPAINAPTLAKRFLSLRSWEVYWRGGDSHGRGLSAHRLAELLYNKGPCVGVLYFVAPLYQHIDADADDTQVYTTGGCAWSDDARRKMEKEHGKRKVGWHAVVLYDYRFLEDGQTMHVLILDNHTPTGPRRWIHVDEFAMVYTLTV